MMMNSIKRLCGCLLAAVIAGLSLPSPASSAPIKVIIDTDPAMGYKYHDVDDGLMLIIALNSPELEILGVTAAWGNHTQDKTFAKAKEILFAAGRKDISSPYSCRARRKCSSRYKISARESLAAAFWVEGSGNSESTRR